VIRTRLGVARAAVIALLAACASEPPRQVPATDTQTPEVVEAAPAPPPPQAPENRIGRIQLLNTIPPVGECLRQGSEVEPRWTFEGDEFPRRSIRVGAGAPSRAFVPSFLEVRASQPGATGVTETETIYVLFSPEGLVETGTRQYLTTGTSTMRQSGGLLPGDSAVVKELALSVLQRCQPKP